MARIIQSFAFRRVALFLFIVWAAASLNFFLPRLAPNRDPVRDRLGQILAGGGSFQQGFEDMVKEYQKKFGLDQPLWLQYLRYLGNTATFDLGYSMANYPTRVIDLVLSALPWTVGLLAMATLIAFAIGSVAGAVLGWGRTPTALGYVLTPVFAMSAVPYYLLGLILVYFLAFKLRIFPLSGGYQVGTQPEWDFSFAMDVLRHSIVPALSIIISQAGFWALGMRAMMVSVEGEDYVLFAEAKGLPSRVIFFWYAMRNAILPQVTSLGLSLGTIVSSSLLVEVIFSYPGIGTLLYRAIAGFDYFLIYGIVFIVIVAIGLATLVLDLVYPRIDPRINYSRS